MSLYRNVLGLAAALAATLSLSEMVTGSHLLRECAGEGKVQFVGAYYELASGQVYFSEPVIVAPVGEVHPHGGHN